jgi:hypothetical protein
VQTASEVWFSVHINNPLKDAWKAFVMALFKVAGVNSAHRLADAPLFTCHYRWF